MRGRGSERVRVRVRVRDGWVEGGTKRQNLCEFDNAMSYLTATSHTRITFYRNR